jgi:hypothetical protein
VTVTKTFTNFTSTLNVLSSSAGAAFGVAGFTHGGLGTVPELCAWHTVAANKAKKKIFTGGLFTWMQAFAD